MVLEASSQSNAAGGRRPRIFFDASKKETYLPGKNLKLLTQKLRQFATVNVSREGITLETLQSHDVVVIPTPLEPLTEHELQSLIVFCQSGGAVLLTLADGHGGRWASMNSFLDKHLGVTLNEDCVVHTIMHKYLHPKEVVIKRGITNREINRLAGKAVVGVSNAFPQVEQVALQEAADEKDETNTDGGKRDFSFKQRGPSATDADLTKTCLVFAYPYGLTLNVQQPSFSILSSGFMAFPLNRPICSVREFPSVSKNGGSAQIGRFVILGSGGVFDDEWLPREENDKLVSILFDLLLNKVKLNQIDANEPDITDYHHLPDTAALSERVRVAVEQTDDLPRDFTKLFYFTPFRLDMNLVPEVCQCYGNLGMKVENLTLIAPDFVAPLPPCAPATFDPAHRDLPPPNLDLFDLDEQFAPVQHRLAQLTNKCHESSDLELYIIGAAEIIGLTKELDEKQCHDPRECLNHVFKKIVEYKKQAVSGAGTQYGASIGRASRSFESSLLCVQPRALDVMTIEGKQQLEESQWDVSAQ